MIGLPGDIYSFGTVVVYSTLSMPIAVFVASKIYLPVFYKLQVTSVFEVRKPVLTRELAALSK